jgi:hypothetical protein
MMIPVIVYNAALVLVTAASTVSAFSSLSIGHSRHAIVPLYATWSNGQAGTYWLIWDCNGLSFQPTDCICHVRVNSHSTRPDLCLALTVQDYQNFLRSGQQQVKLSADQPSVFMGPDQGSPLIDALVQMGVSGDMVLTPGQELPHQLDGETEYPIYIVLPPVLLDVFLANLPDIYLDRAEDFVFFSGGLDFGNIEDVLKNRGTSFYSSISRLPEASLSQLIVHWT